MPAENKPVITVDATINCPVEQVWNFWTMPEHVMKWNSASDDWHTPRAENDLRVNGKFLSRMEAKDGNFGFDFGGTYTIVDKPSKIEYTMDDSREVKIFFRKAGDQTEVIESFEAENQNSLELQKTGWQAILNNFKKYAEANK